MAGYAGYSGYSDEAVKRQRAIADALYKRMLDERGQPIESWTQGAAKLANAYFAREAMGKADAAETGFQDARKALADKMLGEAFPGAAAPTESGPAYDLTPGAMEQRQGENALRDQVKGVADITGDPMAALEYGQGLQDRDLKRQELELQRKVLAQKIGAPIEVSKGATLYDPLSKSALYTAPDPTAAAGPKLHSTLIDDQGKPHQLFSDGADKVLPWKVQDQIGTFDVGGVPYMFSRRGTSEPTPATTAAEAGQNKGTVAAGEALGKSQAEAIKNLPEIITNADRAIASIDELLNSKGFNDAYGLGKLNPAGWLPGSDRKNAEGIRSKLDGQFFVSAITAMQVSLAPVSDADALRLVASISQLTNSDISPEEARRVAGELKGYFQAAKAKARLATQRGPIRDAGAQKLAQVMNDADYDALPSKAFFLDPHGVKRQKP